MQRDLLAEVHLSNLEFKNQEKIPTHKLTALRQLLQENNKDVKNCATKSLLYKTAAPVGSKTTPINSALSRPTRNVDSVNGKFIVNKSFTVIKKPFTLSPKYFQNGNKVPSLNSSINELPRSVLKAKNCPIDHKVFNSSNDSSNASEVCSVLPTNHLNSDDKRPASEPNDSAETKPVCDRSFLKNSNGKTQFQIKQDKDIHKYSCSNSLLLNSNAKSSCIENSGAETEIIINDHDLSCENESKPFCVISEVIGNADAAFSGEIDSFKSETKSSNCSIDCSANETQKTKSKQSSSVDNNSKGINRDALETFAITDEKTDAAYLKKNVNQNLKELEAVSSSKQSNDTDPNSLNSISEVLETKTNISEKGKFEESNAFISNAVGVKKKEKTIIEKIQTVHNEKNYFSASVEPLTRGKQLELQLITPKKTNDITKIKGWRRKQFLIEKPTSVEFYRISKGPKHKKINVKNVISKSEDSGNVENAFVCDSLDEFLNGEVELKVGYEIPHLYAEVGIKLTSEDIASKPNLSRKDFKEVENRYRISVKGENDVANLDGINEKNCKSSKRPTEDEPKRSKILKLDEDKHRVEKISLKNAEQTVVETEQNISASKCKQNYLKACGTEIKVTSQSTLNEESRNNLKLESKLLGLVVYPGPLKPLHPIVRHHVEKLRSYSTKIDRNWANFAVSAVFLNEKQYKRKILPVYCCVKIGKCDKLCNKTVGETLAVNSSFEKVLSKKAKKVQKSAKHSKKKIKLKECSVVVDKINLVGDISPWCMEHNVYNCEPCGLSKTKSKYFKSPKSHTKKTCTKRNLNGSKNVLSRSSFDLKLANLLGKKLRALKFKGGTSTDISCLKTLVPDSVEFIKLNLVKESFLNANINVWYLKQQASFSGSRAFLTFSKTPPVPNAINLKFNTFPPKHLPKVITEIVSSEKVFSPNEYAILHCNGNVWEIHGSLNIAIENSNKNTEQIFASSHMPELEELQKVAQNVLKVKAVKWWVLDLTQKFRLIEINFGNIISIVSRNRFIEMARCESHGFVPVRKDKKGRVLGAYIIGSLLPFILMGPYYLVESLNMTLKDEWSTLSFMYFVKKNVMKDCPLKFFINSAIKDVEENDKVLDGLWLYDKMCLDNTSYIEVMTRKLENPVVQDKFSCIDIDHRYSLNSLTNSSSQGKTSGIAERTNGQEEFKEITVYLYFDVPELGYVEGDLQRDNSVIICHPLDQRTKVKSHKVGDWFVRTIKRRIEFIPKDMEVKWFITRHKEDLRERRPFNKFLLGGAHVLTRKGIFYLLEMSESKIHKLGLKKNEIVKAITENQVIRMVLEMKNLARLFSNNDKESLTMERVLTLAISEIKNLKSLSQSLESEKIKAEKKRLNLTSNFLVALSSCQMKNKVKLKLIENIENFFVKRNGDLNEQFVKKLIKYRIGRQYLRRNGKFYQYIEKVRDTNDSYSNFKRNSMEKGKKLQILLSSLKQRGSSCVKTLDKKSTTPDDESPSTYDTL